MKKKSNGCPLFIMIIISVIAAMAIGLALGVWGDYTLKVEWDRPVFSSVVLGEKKDSEIKQAVKTPIDDSDALDVMADGVSEDTANDALDVNDNVNGSEENKDSEGDGDSADPQVIITNVDADDDSNDSAEGENSDKSALNDDPMAGLNRMDDIEDVTGKPYVEITKVGAVEFVPWNDNPARSPYYKNPGVRPLSSKYEYKDVDADYFATSLFIGDSRIEGLHDYSGWDKAYFAYKTGLSVFNMMSETLNTNDGKCTLSEVLENYTFDNIYIMIGINELGSGTVSDFADKYKENLETIRSLQQDARIIILGIMYVTKEYSDSSDVYNNDNINAKNAAIASFANGSDIFYLDMNPAVVDENMALREDISFDGVHLIAKYYYLWTDFMCSHGY
ncbi:SGNH/GDSL hydrolase family protein [Lacrimispora saccharolytica]|uniref:SGNH/GDSL hydrolase family protein n=1 Tax=Lacrimispora saccharolytica TaxID=84030 RepID=UPI00265D3937|nr:SGNH/GDSL hydrolase family protein [Lacrimispora saccharolytica]MCF2656436.1 SGNH/GDSL hydrolase family protein [Lacrimispora saccharolytica]